jgi:hypothetical protein
MSPEELGKLFGTVAILGGALVYVLGRIAKGRKARGRR